MRRPGILALLMLAAGASFASDADFSLHLGELHWPPPDPRTEARRAVWNSPMGRLMYEMAQQRAGLGLAGLPGGGSALALRLKLQPGLAPALVAASLNSGAELYEQRMKVIVWPWDETPEDQSLPVEQQISLILGRRLEIR